MYESVTDIVGAGAMSTRILTLTGCQEQNKFLGKRAGEDFKTASEDYGIIIGKH